MRQEEVLQSISEIRKKKRGARWYVFRCLYLIALVLVGVYLIFPFLYMVMRSIMNYGDAGEYQSPSISFRIRASLSKILFPFTNSRQSVHAAGIFVSSLSVEYHEDRAL